MGNGVAKAGMYCFANDTTGDISRRHDDMVVKGLGHSFCYIKADHPPLSHADVYQPKKTTKLLSISGASVSANTSSSSSSSTATSSTDVSCPYSSNLDEASAFESSDSFASVPLQPAPRRSGQLQSASVSTERGILSGPMERGFLSGPIERGFVSAPIDYDTYSGLVEKEKEKENSTSKLQKSSSLAGETEPKNEKRNVIKSLKRAMSDTISRGKRSLTGDGTGIKVSTELRNGENFDGKKCSLSGLSGEMSLKKEVEEYGVFPMQGKDLQWAQGKAGEDRVHIVISEEHGWIFVGIYDGFNGADAPDFLLSNLYANVNEELKGLLCKDKFDFSLSESDETEESSRNENHQSGCGYMTMDSKKNSIIKQRKNSMNRNNQRRERCEWARKRTGVDGKLKEKLSPERSMSDGFNHFDVLKALSKALKKTEEAFFEMADKMALEKPELALMGSCVLLMLMKGVDVYLMNVGDSRAVLAQKKTESDHRLGKGKKDLERISEESLREFQVVSGDGTYRLSSFNSIQLTMDHSTYVHKEVERIKREHPDDPCAVTNDRVKGYLKVTRAFGVAFLKQPKWNDLLLEMFRIDYVGKSPYITCFPSLCHHRLSSRDRFLILSSDGLYQYFTNEEAVSEVEFFIAAFPESDPAQHLIEEVLFRAAKRAGMDFHELLDIPQGDRRRYHDDVSVIIITLEGRLWRSSM